MPYPMWLPNRDGKNKDAAAANEDDDNPMSLRIFEDALEFDAPPPDAWHGVVNDDDDDDTIAPNPPRYAATATAHDLKQLRFGLEDWSEGEEDELEEHVEPPEEEEQQQQPAVSSTLQRSVSIGLQGLLDVMMGRSTSGHSFPSPTKSPTARTRRATPAGPPPTGTVGRHDGT